MERRLDNMNASAHFKWLSDKKEKLVYFSYFYKMNAYGTLHNTLLLYLKSCGISFVEQITVFSKGNIHTGNA